MKRLLTVTICITLLVFLLVSCGKTSPAAGGEGSLDALAEKILLCTNEGYVVSLHTELSDEQTRVFGFVSGGVENGGGSLRMENDALYIGEVRADLHGLLEDVSGVAVFEDSLDCILDAFAVSPETEETVRANMLYYSEDEVTHLLYADGVEIKSCRYPVEDITELVITVTKWEGDYPEPEGVLIRQPYSIF